MREIAEADLADLFARCFSDAMSSVFKLEVNQHYQIDNDQAFDAFSRGETALAARIAGEVLRADKEVAALVERGVSLYRARLFSLPLSAYLKFELSTFSISEELGEQISFLPFEDFIGQEGFGEDFLMFDDRQVLVSQFDEAGRWQRTFWSADAAHLAHYAAVREKALSMGMPLAEFKSTFQP